MCYCFGYFQEKNVIIPECYYQAEVVNVTICITIIAAEFYFRNLIHVEKQQMYCTGKLFYKLSQPLLAV